MSWTGRNSVKAGSKWAHFTCLCTPNGPGSLVEKHIFDPIFTHFGSQNDPFSRHFGIFNGPICVTTGSKRCKNTCLSIPNGLGSLLEKCFFDPFLTRYWSQSGPFSRHFAILHGPICVTTGSKRAKSTCLSIPHGPQSLLEKCLFHPFLTHFGPKLAPFQGILGFSMGQNASPRAQNGLKTSV